MNATSLNTGYWTELPAKKIIGQNAEPNTELFERLSPHTHILDLGCGNGSVSEVLSAHGYHVTGVDLNTEAIRAGQNRNSAVTYLVGDVLKGLPFEDASFDAVVLSFVLVNIIPQAEREKAVRELRRVLKPGGYVWVNEGTASEEYALRYTLSYPYTHEERSFFVYREGTSSKDIQTAEQLAQAVAEKRVARIAHHFTNEELRELFNGFKEVFFEASATQSPNSKMRINMSTWIFEKV